MSKSAFPESDNFAFVESGSMYQAQTEPVMDPGAVTVEVSGRSSGSTFPRDLVLSFPMMEALTYYCM